ncbi:MAG: winged helix-turn-helix transcriptional regulator [Clostridia bacterium]|nr:winged helix-turn-helix transcriptional regulator [Clostridia bacterium]
MEQNIQVLKALAHPTRLEILMFLKNKDSACVCKIYETLNLEQSNISQHLRILKSSGILESNKIGQWVHYRVTHKEIFDILDLVENIATK